ncbi:MAG TPA: hypothetical protein C5S51_06945 [Methanosarcinaceae archaeon]|nr:hypothetical protein [Methanosarcinaceae archaeon]
MSDIYILNEMIKDNAKISPEENYSKLKIILPEPQHPDSSATIYGLPNDAITIKVDTFKSPDTIFNCSNDECKRSDFVIISDNGNKKVILHIEMKTTKGKTNKDIIKQLKGGDCFVTYCRKIGKEFWNKQDFLDGYNTRFISIEHTRISKKKTRITRNPGVHDSPKRMLKIDSPHHLQFNHLAGK